jgi:hypothetical protein
MVPERRCNNLARRLRIGNRACDIMGFRSNDAESCGTEIHPCVRLFQGRCPATYENVNRAITGAVRAGLLAMKSKPDDKRPEMPPEVSACAVRMLIVVVACPNPAPSGSLKQAVEDTVEFGCGSG